MASSPKDSGRKSFRKSLRYGFDRFTHAVLPSPRPPSRGSGTSAPSGSGARSVSPAPSATPAQSAVIQSAPPHEIVNIVPPSPGPTAIDKLKEAGGVALSGLEAALRLLEKSADPFPPLKAAVAGFVGILDLVQTATVNAEEYEALTSELTTLMGTLKQYLSELGSEDSSGSASRIALFSPDGTRIASGSSDQTIRVWDTHTGDTVAGPFQGHTRQVNSVAFSPDGTHVVSVSNDETMRVWNVYIDDPIAGLLMGHAGLAGPAGFSLDGTHTTSRIDHNQNNPSPNPAITNFTVNTDGWVTIGHTSFFWISPDLRVQIPFPYNTFAIGSSGSLSINYRDLMLGERWSECYISL